MRTHTIRLAKSLSVVIAAASTTLIAIPAQAQSAEALECPRLEVSSSLRALIRKDLTGQSSAADSEAVIDQSVELTNRCIARHGVVTDQSEAYGEYAFAVVAMDIAGETLTGAGVDVAVVNRIFDVGPGAANDGNVEFDEPRIVALLDQGLAPGTDIEAVPESVWAMLGVYVAAAADYHTYRESR